MKVKVLVTLIVLGSFSMQLHAQSNLLNAKVPQEIGTLNKNQSTANNTAPLSYGYIDDRDVMWSKTIWELIDLDQRINFPFYYPTDTINIGSDRRSLFHVLKEGIKSGAIKEVYDDDYFKFKLSFDEIEEKLVAIDTLDAGRDQLNAGEKIDPQYINKRTITSREIRQYWVKGIWYFDRRLGELKYRMLGIAPVAPDVNFLNQAEEEQDLIPLFWIWYPDARVTLHNTKVFNKENTSRPISFDNLLNSRRFSSIIYKEDNVYEDRKIGDYIFEDAMLRLMESDRIKAKILNFEQDMWNN